MTASGIGPAPQAGKTLVTLVAGGSAASREGAIADALVAGTSIAVILEGLADGSSPLAELASTTASLSPFASRGEQPATDTPPAPQILRIAPGCLCCAGNLILRVTLNRLLRHPPTRIYISLATSTHIGQLRESLSSMPYEQWLSVGDDIVIADTVVEPLAG
jgi:hypothetical protein